MMHELSFLVLIQGNDHLTWRVFMKWWCQLEMQKWPHHGTWVNIGSCFPQAIGYFEKSNDAWIILFSAHSRERPFNFIWFFSKKKYSDSQCCWKKYSDFGGGKKNNNLKKKILNETKNHNSPCKLNGRSLISTCRKLLTKTLSHNVISSTPRH